MSNSSRVAGRKVALRVQLRPPRPANCALRTKLLASHHGNSYLTQNLQHDCSQNRPVFRLLPICCGRNTRLRAQYDTQRTAGTRDQRSMDPCGGNTRGLSRGLLSSHGCRRQRRICGYLHLCAPFCVGSFCRTLGRWHRAMAVDHLWCGGRFSCDVDNVLFEEREKLKGEVRRLRPYELTHKPDRNAM